jgi:biopolymer transport protein ExbD
MAMHLGDNRGHGEPELMLDINTTPLIDVMLVLLIMLIITIPAQLDALTMDMPRPIQASRPVEPRIVKLEVDAANTVHWNGQPLVSPAALDSKLAEAAALNPQPELHIHAEGKARYAAVAAVLAGAQRHGLSKLGIVGTEQFGN